MLRLGSHLDPIRESRKTLLVTESQRRPSQSQRILRTSVSQVNVVPGLGAKETFNHKRQSIPKTSKSPPYFQKPISYHPVTSPRILRYVNIDFGVPSAGFAALIGFLGMEIQIVHRYGSIQTALLGRFP